MGGGKKPGKSDGKKAGGGIVKESSGEGLDQRVPELDGGKAVFRGEGVGTWGKKLVKRRRKSIKKGDKQDQKKKDSDA